MRVSNVIGLSCFFHDAACCLLRDGRLVAAAEEERFTRIKHDRSLPSRAFQFCLREAGLDVSDVGCVAFYEEPALKLGRQLWMLAKSGDSRMARRLDADRPARQIRDLLGYEGPIVYVPHHLAHAASSYCYSGFDEAAIMTVDGVGEWATTTYGHGRDGEVSLFESVDYPDSIGLLYSTITSYLGFDVNDGEYKVMGLAPYGSPTCVDRFHQLLTLGDDGQYALDLRFFDFIGRDAMYTAALPELFGMPPRTRESELTARHADVARSLQAFLEFVLLEKLRYLHRRVPCPRLCMAGGVALNCVANHHLLTHGPFERLYIGPAPHDAGGALGAAALAHRQMTGAAIPRQRIEHACWGPRFSADDIAALLAAVPMPRHDFGGREDRLLEAVVDRLAAGKVIGWFHGRMEFGPRALGARSILADPRREEMRDRINAIVKKRESFRPFAPSVLESHRDAHFDLGHPSPFMLETCQVRSPLTLPAITHVDGSARPQTVDDRHSPRFAALLRAFDARTGCPLLLNTSFNVRDEPIVCTPVDALLCFARSQLDALVLEDVILDRDTDDRSWIPWVELLAGVAAATRTNVSDRAYTFV